MGQDQVTSRVRGSRLYLPCSKDMEASAIRLLLSRTTEEPTTCLFPSRGMEAGVCLHLRSMEESTTCLLPSRAMEAVVCLRPKTMEK